MTEPLLLIRTTHGTKIARAPEAVEITPESLATKGLWVTITMEDSTGNSHSYRVTGSKDGRIEATRAARYIDYRLPA